MEFNVFTAIILPIALGIIMLGMGLSLVPEDFQRITKYPKAVAIGLISQLIILPIIGFIVANVVPMQPEIAVGFIILSICPGGPSSNLITYLAKGDVVLSITLTAFSSIITVFTIPILANLALQNFIGQSASIQLPIGQTMLQIFIITLVPCGLGMWIRQQFPDIARRLEKVTNNLAAIFLIVIISAIIIREWSRLPGFIIQVGIGVVLLNLLSCFAGFLSSRLFKLNLAQSICIAIEVGIQNGTLAIAITAGILKNPDMAVPAAVYSLFMYVTAFIAIFSGRKFTTEKLVNLESKS
ncbi:bile acid:sodium symporter family protein [Calothrix sp. UHCC 0171]|uniref:bile acid:sodium symporter family protein n=1 Tax=Calothrix sp. UHCC 0171 TaxID=3110245 RepID=UPI002B2050AE|nr:bile acid:sodium symporter family protein [Calothrix sp. UHCC 0171]MEA5574672.1 bile acid:sodium symporter family protein [Calothrix sp. UHCC 0171]